MNKTTDSRKKLEIWAKLLLDMGKRNNLINFHDTKGSSAELVYPMSEAIYEKAEGKTAFEVYAVDMKTAQLFAEPAPADVTDVDAEESPESEPPALTAKDAYIKAFSGKLKKASQILLYNPSTAPTDVVKNIEKRAKTAIEETGVNIAYLAFGFIHWKDGANTDNRAPILLTAVSISIESAISPWKIKTLGDGMIVNPTFAFKLEQEYGITLPVPEEDEALPVYLTRVEELVSKLGWHVTDECKIGLFSFLKLNMYRDLTDHADEVLANPNIKRLLGIPVSDKENEDAADENAENGRLAGDGRHAIDESRIGSENPRKQAKCAPLFDIKTVVNADSSQLEALEMARSGMSFVLQGPPGTGKSQTITNMIAAAIGDGKKVLFVSEKQAALNVVYDKLKKAGLDEFCLELHSYKANKKDVIDNLCTTLRSPKHGLSKRVDEELNQRAFLHAELEDYENELHKTRDDMGMSLYELFDEYSEYGEENPYIGAGSAPRIFDTDLKTRADLLAGQNRFREYERYTKTFGADYRQNSWFGYKNSETNYREQLADLEDMVKLAKALAPISAEIEGDYGVRASCISELLMWREIFTVLATSDFFAPEYLTPSGYQALRQAAKPLEDRSKALRDERARLRESYESGAIETLPAADMEGQLTKLYTGFFSRLSGGYRDLIRSLRMASKTGRKPNYEEAIRMAHEIAEYQTKIGEYHDSEPEIIKKLPGYHGIDTDFATLRGECSCVARLLDIGRDFGKIAEMSEDAFLHGKTEFGNKARRIEEALLPNRPMLERVKAHFDQDLYNPVAEPVEKVAEKVEKCLEMSEIVDVWSHFSELLAQIKAARELEFLNAALDEKATPEELPNIYKKQFLLQKINGIIHESQTLSRFSAEQQEQTIHDFYIKDQMQFEFRKLQIRAERSKDRPQTDMIAPGSMVATLLREGEKKRRQMSIRNLLERVGELVQVIKPCFLMSPLSVSTYLGSPSIHFDMVVFDEASQIFPQDAVGSIYRGDQLIVVGDSRQMPPSNFFNTTVDVADEDAADEITDFESILDICSASMPQKRLKWHYRSRNESLIAFSNRHFYDGDLVTFPSAAEENLGAGVDYYYVNGIFEHRSRTNRAEAEAVVDRIFDHIGRYPDRSLGVVAFSIAQQDMIERILLARRMQDPSREAFFRGDVPEPFFIKNLETVQGDERDTIIFSTAYGRDKEGKLLHNFGPLNRVGGERRLNVAITRAKINVQLVTSMHFADIEPTRTSAKGALLLREYLKYAESGDWSTGGPSLDVAFTENEHQTPSLESTLAVFLEANGYEIKRNVGCSHFKVGIALCRRDTPGYALAIEVDGPTYHAAANVRDREWLRFSILEGMGWKCYRVWSTEWWKHPEKEKAKLLAACEAALTPVNRECASGGPSPDVPSTENEHQAPSPATTFHAENERQAPSPAVTPESIYEEDAQEDHTEFAAYKFADVPAVLETYEKYVDVVRAILEVEAPMSEEWLMKRTLAYFGSTKYTQAVRESFEMRMKNCAERGIIRRNGFLYLEGAGPIMLRVPTGEEKREIKYICPEELADGIYEILRANVSADKIAVYKLLAKLLGHPKLGKTMEEQMEHALGLLSEVITIEHETITLNT